MNELKWNFIISIYNSFLNFWIKLSFLYAYLCKISYDDLFKDIIRKVQANSTRTLEGRKIQNFFLEFKDQFRPF